VIDALDAALAKSLARWETGESKPLPMSELEPKEWFLLSDYERRCIEKRPRDADGEWLEISVAGLLLGLMDEVGFDWAVEAARHLAVMLVEREDRVCTHAAEWGKGVKVQGRLIDVITQGFPNAGLGLETAI
jgi:hypothetical protein